MEALRVVAARRTVKGKVNARRAVRTQAVHFSKQLVIVLAAKFSVAFVAILDVLIAFVVCHNYAVLLAIYDAMMRVLCKPRKLTHSYSV